MGHEVDLDITWRAGSLNFYLTKLARLGGYLARTSDPPPGNTVVWRGLSRLTDIRLGTETAATLMLLHHAVILFGRKRSNRPIDQVDGLLQYRLSSSKVG
ncbi:hypothetical protein LPU83_pLPU83b_0193 (plasmid) [Rhizobium favelukesii]|uniref:Transposase Tn5 dimerisation domain-containing protein n=1 Tax=Rhizobium favelukesii TaxID=348824 RepID=W6RMN2_9HYPH|nr:hypothetical protein LPU83_pLPU83b_0193 [Rhizobium favelukesii]